MWIDSDQDRDYLRALVNVALMLKVPYTTELVNYCKDLQTIIVIVKFPLILISYNQHLLPKCD